MKIILRFLKSKWILIFLIWWYLSRFFGLCKELNGEKFQKWIEVGTHITQRDGLG